VLNAVPLATTVDGCVPEMMEMGDVGWPFGMMKVKNGDRNYKGDSYALYSTLASIRDLYYHSLGKGLFDSGGPSLWVDKMISCVSEVTPYFLTPRMVSEYRKSVWDL
jgi:glucan phosphorylase